MKSSPLVFVFFAFIFVASAFYRGYQTSVLHSPQITSDLPVNDTNYEPSSFCSTNGSLHQLALDMFHYSSPPGSTSYKKLRHVLDANSDFYIDMGTNPIFDKNKESLIRMLEGYGLRLVSHRPSNPQNVTLVETLFAKKSICPITRANCRNRPRIFIQTEQYFKDPVLICHKSPNCIILDFSEYNYVKAQQHNVKDFAQSFVLLPVMTQTPSRLSIFEPAVPKVLQNRSIDMFFSGCMTTRRKPLFKASNDYMEAHPGRKVEIEQTNNASFIADHYKEAKVCLLAHSYDHKSGGELHRLSEFAQFGCIPVMEHFSDRIGIDIYEQCGGAVFEKFTNLIQTGADIVAKIDQGFYKGRENSIIDWWKTGIHWERILPTVFGV